MRKQGRRYRGLRPFGQDADLLHTVNRLEFAITGVQLLRQVLECASPLVPSRFSPKAGFATRDTRGVRSHSRPLACIRGSTPQFQSRQGRRKVARRPRGAVEWASAATGGRRRHDCFHVGPDLTGLLVSAVRLFLQRVQNNFIQSHVHMDFL
jgi:hypothetical protein